VVRHAGRGGGKVLYDCLRQFPYQTDQPLWKSRSRAARQETRLGDGRGFEVEGQTFVALNGGPHFKFTEAVSFQVTCETQDEIDYFWSKLSEGGQAGSCGWLKDKYGLSWQIVPSALPQLLTDTDSAKSERAMIALMKMKKFDIETLQRAYAGQD
jgi:predicted 3-demethylubiquinone-9 3-methyltransferase (glyoxalase superfamily)